MVIDPAPLSHALAKHYLMAEKIALRPQSRPVAEDLRTDT